jgi:AP-2 complex subunit mu-1
MIVGTKVVLKIPTPANTAQQQVRVKFGKVKYDATGNCFNWIIKKFPGGQTYDFTASVTLISTLVKKSWSRPPISMEFDVPVMASGLQVRFLKVIEPKLRYECIKWVRYITRAGTYSVRIS